MNLSFSTIVIFILLLTVIPYSNAGGVMCYVGPIGYTTQTLCSGIFTCIRVQLPRDNGADIEFGACDGDGICGFVNSSSYSSWSAYWNGNKAFCCIGDLCNSSTMYPPTVAPMKAGGTTKTTDPSSFPQHQDDSSTNYLSITSFVIMTVFAIYQNE